jgi:DNA-binding IclR family transcriptional regulator
MKSLDRLVAILRVVGAGDQPASAAQVADATGLSLSTVSRLMIQFAEVGLLHRTPQDRTYTLGPLVHELSRSSARDADLVAASRPFLEQLRDRSDETCSVHVLSGSQRLCVAAAASRHPVRRVVTVGLAEPAAGSATGAVLMARRPIDERRAEARSLGRAARRPFSEAMAHAAQEGWALVSDEWVEGVTGLSAAVRGADGVDAALSISGPSARFTPTVAMKHLGALLAAAGALSGHVREEN